MRPKPLPRELGGRSFSLDEARDAGVPDKRLRAQDLEVPYRGLRNAGPPPENLRERCEEYAPRLALGQFFCGTTALALHGAPLRASDIAGDLHVGARPPQREPRLAGIAGHRVRLAGDIARVGMLPVASPPEAWAQAAGVLPLDELVVAADGLLHVGATSIPELQSTIELMRRRGAVDLRQALDEARPGSESAQETRTRLVLVRGGLPEPELNWELRRSGRLVARLDMAYPAYRVCVEYDGRHHAEVGQFARDADRWATIETEGWILVRVLAHHLRSPHRIVARTRRALISRGWSIAR